MVKLQLNEKYNVFLREFITNIIFMSKHFNYNIHFLNMVSVRWRPLLSAHSGKRRTSDKCLTQSFDVLKVKALFLDLSFLQHTLLLCSFPPTTVQYCHW